MATTVSKSKTEPVEVPVQEVAKPEAPRKERRRRPRQQGIYSKVLITRHIPLNITTVGKGIKETLETAIAGTIEGRCVVEGYVKPKSTSILTYSSGIMKSNYVVFEVAFECLVCSPVEGMHIECVAKNITKAGIRAETNEDPSPVVVFVSRDHHYASTYFSSIKADQDIKVRVIGQRFELNDKYISVIAELIEPREEKAKRRRKPKLIITG